MRYATDGDYYFVGDDKRMMQIDVRRSGDWRKDWCVLVHEIVECALLMARGIRFEAVDRWDRKHSNCLDPGSCKGSPYRKEHRFALKVEESLCRRSWC